MLSQFNIQLPATINTKLRNHVKKYNIIEDVNLIRMDGFDVFTVGHDGLIHARICNLEGKWMYSIVDPHALDDDGDELERVEE